MESDHSNEAETTFAITDGSPSDTVLRALSTVHDGELSDMRPLYDVIDPDALDDLFRGPNPGTVTFQYEEYTVIVRENAEVVVRE